MPASVSGRRRLERGSLRRPLRAKERFTFETMAPATLETGREDRPERRQPDPTRQAAFMRQAVSQTRRRRMDRIRCRHRFIPDT
jgi:hypothetical protein